MVAAPHPPQQQFCNSFRFGVAGVATAENNCAAMLLLGHAGVATGVAGVATAPAGDPAPGVMANRNKPRLLCPLDGVPLAPRAGLRFYAV